MKASEAFRGHFMPKKRFVNRTLKQCTKSRERDDIVLIDLDCDDIGDDVIILDIPESFREKFGKKVIMIDDDDDGGDSRDGVCDMNTEATTSYRCSPTSAAPSSNCADRDNDATTNTRFPSTSAARSSKYDADVDKDGFVSEGNTPVNLYKSKRTYSGKSRNRYGLSSDSESSSESDCSDCELMEGSCEKLREQWEKATLRRGCDTGCDRPDAENKAGTSAAYQPDHYSDDESASEHSGSDSQQSNSSAADLESEAQKLAEESKLSQNNSVDEEINGQFAERHNGCGGFSDPENKGCTFAPDQPVHHSAEQREAEHTELPTEASCFRSSINRDSHALFGDSSKPLAEQGNGSQQYGDAKEMGKVFNGGFSSDVTKEAPNQNFERDHPAFTDSEQDAGRSIMRSDNNCVHDSDTKNSDQYNIITDREKMKETDEYKRAMEEEWASRQQQLQRQAEEAQRLRSRKRAQKMRIMVNERRQKQRIEEIRETRRKDEENLNLKDKLRAEIRKELRKLEATCDDMASLLRSLGIHVGGSRYPSPNEVQAAYKRACLKFHPDRLSSTDLRQQVEAEEKFKLISNMKEKFSLK